MELTFSTLNLGAALLGGLLSAGHCVGMCGGLIAACAMRHAQHQGHLPAWSPARVTPHLLYHGGRLLVYVCLGAIIGYLGSVADAASALAGARGLPQLLAGAAMLLMGLATLGWLPWNLERGFAADSRLGRLYARLMQQGSALSMLPLGMLTGLLPCGLHWAFQAQAAASGSALGGALIMSAFVLGTIPPLLLFALIAGWMSAHARQRLLQAAALLVMLMGGQLLIRGAGLAGWL
ncbi:sulfite exporter TauE/SafE family protein [Magnetofaba australis]|uniref:Urease accessory protein UreH-like transmembrane domain-containing protein n=1 Tax=Magnetofaba australis IT-1 TaxID=1434232 RepID=A0A1Y2K5Z2_9PROT|nr:sulfite exporter TauE/SafE family protein [Magnetofaba australis]OSM02534.1 hypothetical protein MAIT1_02692 [Magnetofaba australis IT-1]